MIASRPGTKSHDGGDTWDPCWNATNLTGSFADLVIKDSSTMFLLRRGGQVPLRTKDAGKTWDPLHSFTPVAAAGFSMDLSWSGKTMVVHGVVTQNVDGLHQEAGARNVSRGISGLSFGWPEKGSLRRGLWKWILRIHRGF